MLRKVLFSFLLLIPTLLSAQSALTGNIFDNTNRSILLEGATVRNITNKTVTLTDKDGHFNIAAKVGDLVSFGMVGYQTDTVYLTNLFPRNIYLRALVNNLNTVNIIGTKISPYLDLKNPNAMPSRQVEYSKEKGGVRLALGYNRFKKQQFKIQELEEQEQYREEINKNFSEEFVRDLIKLEGADLKNFIQMFRPTVDQVKSEQPFNYALYTAKSYRVWLKLPIDQRKLPPLIKPLNN